MNRRAVGCVFVAIAALLYAARFVSAAIFMSNLQNWSRDLFLGAMSYVGPDLHRWALAALLIGVLYLIWGEWSDLKRRA
ncbi:MAG TPA: hypothetical protein VHO48_01670 [Anaerolineaceae bacterium]|jgi:hypothetical protein|nr:hypothetical protein [Anaerolineaceae bacterium]